MIHYLLILLVALVILVGMPMEGFLLVPALLVLPGATGLAISRDLKIVVIGSIVSSVAATVAGLIISRTWNFIPPGPAIVVVLFLEFLVAHARGRIVSNS